MKRLLIIFIFLSVITSCSNERLKGKNIEKKIGDYIQQSCNADVNGNYSQDKSKTIGNCSIPIKNLTDFPWDKLYVFEIPVEDSEIEKITGIPIPTSGDTTRKLIFIKDDKVVYLEENFGDIEKRVDGQLLFVESENGNHYAVYNSETVFKTAVINNALMLEAIK